MTDPLKILILVPALGPVYGGPSVSSIGLAEALGRRGACVDIVTTNANGAVKLAEPVNRWLQRPHYRVRFFSRVGSLEFKLSPSLTTWLWRHVRDYDIVHTISVFNYPTLICCIICGLRGMPYIINPLGMLQPLAIRQKRWKKWLYFNLLERPRLQNASAIHCLTRYESHALAELGIRSTHYVVPNGISPELALEPDAPNLFFDRFSELRNKIVILFLHRVDPMKGLDMLAPAFAAAVKRFPEMPLHLVVAGPPTPGYLRVAQAHIEQAGCSQAVTFTGILDKQVKRGVLSAASIFVAPSYSEGFSMSILEAMAAGLPCLITEGCNFPEAGEAGAARIVEISEKGITAGLCELLADLPTSKAMGSKARSFVRENYSWGNAADATLPIYRAILNTRAGVEAPCDTAPKPLNGRAPAPPLKVLMLIPSLEAIYGGTSKTTPALAAAVGRLGSKVDLVATAANGSETVDVPAMSWVEKGDYRIKYFHRFIQTEYKISFSLLNWLWRHVHDYDVVHINSDFNFPVLACATACRARGVPYLITPHGMLEPWALRYKALKKWFYYRCIERPLVLSAARGIQALNSNELTNLAALDLPPRIFLLPNGVDIEPVNAEAANAFYEQFPAARGKTIILFLHRIDPKKGLDLLAKAYASTRIQFPGTHLIVAGPDNIGFTKTARGFFQDAKCEDAVTFTGMLRGEIKAGALAAASVFVAPSYSEGFSMSVLEAMAAGLPCVITEGCNFPEAADAGAARVVVPTAEAFATALVDTLADLPAACAMGVRARDLVARDYTWDRIAVKAAEIYEEIMRKTPPGDAPAPTLVPR